MSGECIPSGWCRIQTELYWIVLNTKQRSAASEHPGSAAVLGDFNRHDIYRQPGNDVGGPPHRQCIEILSSRPTSKGRAAAARHIRQLLQSSVDELEDRQEQIFEGALQLHLARSQPHQL